MKKMILALLIGSSLLFCGCGTLFHSNRIGQRMSNQIDRSVWIGNVVFGLFGIIPGVVGFILDYNNDTIYYTEAELIPDDFETDGGNRR